MTTLQWSAALALDLPAMDAALALHLRSVGYDVASGDVGRPHALPAAPIHGCGSAACTPAAEADETAAA